MFLRQTIGRMDSGWKHTSRVLVEMKVIPNDVCIYFRILALSCCIAVASSLPSWHSSHAVDALFSLFPCVQELELLPDMCFI